MEINTNLSDKAKFDLILVDRAVSGDQKAFAELMGRYRDAIYFMLLKMVNNKYEIDKEEQKKVEDRIRDKMNKLWK